MHKKQFIVLYLLSCFTQTTYTESHKYLPGFVASVASLTAVSYFDRYTGNVPAELANNVVKFDASKIINLWEMYRVIAHTSFGPFSAGGIPITFVLETWPGLFGKYETYYALRFIVYYTAFLSTYHAWNFCSSKKTESQSPPSYAEAIKR